MLRESRPEKSWHVFSSNWSDPKCQEKATQSSVSTQSSWQDWAEAMSEWIPMVAWATIDIIFWSTNIIRWEDDPTSSSERKINIYIFIYLVPRWEELEACRVGIVLCHGPAAHRRQQDAAARQQQDGDGVQDAWQGHRYNLLLRSTDASWTQSLERLLEALSLMLGVT